MPNPEFERAIAKINEENERRVVLRQGTDFTCEDGRMHLSKKSQHKFSVGPVTETSSYTFVITSKQNGVLVVTTSATISSGASILSKSRDYTSTSTWSALRPNQSFQGTLRDKAAQRP